MGNFNPHNFLDSEISKANLGGKKSNNIPHFSEEALVARFSEKYSNSVCYVHEWKQ